jgi:hypothetical protein
MNNPGWDQDGIGMGSGCAARPEQEQSNMDEQDKQVRDLFPIILSILCIHVGFAASGIIRAMPSGGLHF